MAMCTRTRTASYLAVLAATLGGCAAVAPQVDAWKPAPVGASWAAVQRNTGSYGKDTQTTTTRLADVDWKGSPALAIKTATGTLLQQPADGRWLAFLGPDGKPAITWDPPAGWGLPIGVGSSWKGPRKMTNLSSGKTLEYEWGCTVAAYEKVTVPAGTFDSFRVECRSSADSEDTYWVSPTVHPFLKSKSVRGPKNPAGAGTQETELLKVPS
jgi:hypothetical protein